MEELSPKRKQQLENDLKELVLSYMSVVEYYPALRCARANLNMANSVIRNQLKENEESLLIINNMIDKEEKIITGETQ